MAFTPFPFDMFNVVFTDLEGDDLVALKMIDKTSKNHLIVISGERGEHTTAKRCKEIMDDIGVKSSRERLVFHLNGENPGKAPGIINTALTYGALKLSEWTGGKVFSMKPPRELLTLYEKTGYIPRQDVWAYGSFNHRKLLMEGSVSPETLETYLNSFPHLYLYESFFVTGFRNSVPGSEMQIKDPVLRRYVREWNEHIVAEMPDTSAFEDKYYEDPADFMWYMKNVYAPSQDKLTETEVMSFAMDVKVVADIKTDPHQFLLADAGMIAYQSEYEARDRHHITIDRDSFYPVPSDEVSPEDSTDPHVIMHSYMVKDVYPLLVRRISDRV